MTKFERKFGKYAIPNLTFIIIVCYVIGYVLQMIDRQGIILNWLTLNPSLVLKGQVWRLITWVLIPPDNFDILTIITLLFYFSIGRSLERVWGDFKYNIYIFSGIFFTIIGAFLMYGYALYFDKTYVTQVGVDLLMRTASSLVTTYFICMSLYLAYAVMYPNATVLFMLFIPIKMKWLGVIFGGLIVFDAIEADPYSRIIIIMSLLNFLIFWLTNLKNNKNNFKTYVHYQTQKMEFEASKASVNKSTITKHKCAVCGCTEITAPDREFRFCSKCNGNYEYCNEHLYSHKHVE